MNIADIVKLSVSGYSKDQIKELGTMSKECPDLLDYAKGSKSFDEVKELYDFSKELNSAPDPVPVQEQAPDAGKSDRTAELEQKIKELEDQNTKLNESINKLQSQNLHQDVSGNQPDPMEAFGEIVAAFM